MEESKKLKICMFLICIVFLVLGIFISYKSNDYSLLNDKNSKFFSNESFSPNLSAKRLNKENQGIQEYKIEFNKNDLSHLKTEKLTVFLNKFTDNAFSVKLNDIIIASEGDMKKGRSILKSTPNYFTIDSKLIKEKNKLIINTYGVYKSGLESDGVYITDDKIGIQQARKLNLYGTRLVVLGIGFVIFLALSMVFIHILNRGKKVGILYCAIATMFLGVYIMDHLKIEYFRYDYILYKKIYLIALHMGFWFYVLTMNSFYDCFYLKYSSTISAISFLVIIPFINDFFLFKNIYQLWYIFLLINVLGAFIYSLMNIKKSNEALAFSLLLGVIFIYLGIAILIESIYSSFKMNSPSIYIVMVCMLPIIFGMRELIDKEKELYFEKIEKEENYAKSITDNLTGTFNQRFLYSRLEKLSDEVVVGMIDIDHFKLINDNYGHLMGDNILKNLVILLKNMIRRTDEIYRYGGDEFIVIFHDCTEEDAIEKLEEFRREIEEYDFIYNNFKANITVSIGIYKTLENQKYQEILKKVDKKLYKSKEKGRNIVSI